MPDFGTSLRPLHYNYHKLQKVNHFSRAALEPLLTFYVTLVDFV